MILKFCREVNTFRANPENKTVENRELIAVFQKCYKLSADISLFFLRLDLFRKVV